MDEKAAREISALVDHPAWKSLTELLEAGIDRYWARLAKDFQTPGVTIDQSELDFQRGRLNGALLVLKQPGKAVDLLVKLEAKKEE